MSQSPTHAIGAWLGAEAAAGFAGHPASWIVVAIGRWGVLYMSRMGALAETIE